MLAGSDRPNRFSCGVRVLSWTLLNGNVLAREDVFLKPILRFEFEASLCATGRHKPPMPPTRLHKEPPYCCGLPEVSDGRAQHVTCPMTCGFATYKLIMLTWRALSAHRLGLDCSIYWCCRADSFCWPGLWPALASAADLDAAPQI